MCGGAIIFDYIPARRRVSTADFWPGSEADAEDIHASHSPDPQRGKPCFRLLLCYPGDNTPSRQQAANGQINGVTPCCRLFPCSAAREGEAWAPQEPVPRHPAAAVGQVGGGDPRPREGRPRLARHLPHRRGRRARVRPRREAHQGSQSQGELPQRHLLQRHRADGGVEVCCCCCTGPGRSPAAQGGGTDSGVRRGQGVVRRADGLRELHELPRHPLHGGRDYSCKCHHSCRLRRRRRRRRRRIAGPGSGRAVELRRLLLPAVSVALY
jgi:hypothetical protein